ncbi:MAG: D-tyrosyl-tRNA(Tyr) deacylase [Candidatus Brocadiaceae bacterium]|nr:D-tyrosyl-tRNA(Tyr) deacylase [Candidatus Brocadiaceae bacterium]
MRAVVQRVSEASVRVDGRAVARIGPGLAVLLGVGADDEEADAQYMAGKMAGLRVFSDAEGQMNLSVRDCGGSVLLVSQFTLYGDCRKGRRPSFTGAAEPSRAEALYELTARTLEEQGLPVRRGVFGAHMEVALVNDGPVTVLLDSGKVF